MRAFIILPILFLASCGFLNNKAAPKATLTDLVANNWVLSSLSGKSVLEGTTISLSVSKEGKVKGNSGVNNYFGQWQIKANEIMASKMASTKKFRSEPKGIMQQEQQFLTMLSVVTNWNIVSDELQLFQGNKLIVTFHINEKMKSMK